MDITITQPDTSPPTRFAHSLSMVIKSFKGRRDVEVHLFRSAWDESTENKENWDTLIASSSDLPNDADNSRRVIMEAFSDEERDNIVNYLKEQYSTRLTTIRSTPLSFPVPAGLPGLSQVEPGKDIGFIEFTKIPSYSLGIPLKGLYNLSQHPPMAGD